MAQGRGFWSMIRSKLGSIAKVLAGLCGARVTVCLLPPGHQRLLIRVMIHLAGTGKTIMTFVDSVFHDFYLCTYMTQRDGRRLPDS